MHQYTDSVFFNEVYEGSSLDFDWLALAVEKSQNEMKEITLAKITRRLFLKVRSTQAHAVHKHFTQSERLIIQPSKMSYLLCHYSLQRCLIVFKTLHCVN